MKSWLNNLNQCHSRFIYDIFTVLFLLFWRKFGKLSRIENITFLEYPKVAIYYLRKRLNVTLRRTTLKNDSRLEKIINIAVKPIIDASLHSVPKKRTHEKCIMFVCTYRKCTHMTLNARISAGTRFFDARKLLWKFVLKKINPPGS